MYLFIICVISHLKLLVKQTCTFVVALLSPGQEPFKLLYIFIPFIYLYPKYTLNKDLALILVKPDLLVYRHDFPAHLVTAVTATPALRQSLSSQGGVRDLNV